MTVAVIAPPAPDTILPVLLHRERAGSVGLSDDGFADSPATLALSSELTLGFNIGDSNTRLSHRAVDEMHLTIREAWDIAAYNLQARALTAEGLRFYTRCVSHVLGAGCPAGLQVRAQGSLPTSWLTHPRNFQVFDAHLRRLMRAREVHYLVPDEYTVVALRDCSAHTATQWAQHAAAIRPPHRQGLLDTPVRLVRGFPLSCRAE